MKKYDFSKFDFKEKNRSKVKKNGIRWLRYTILKENFDTETIAKMDAENIYKILNYLDRKGVYYAKALVLSSLDLFLLPADEFIKKFEKLKNKLGNDYIDKLGEDMSLIEMMYED